MEKGTCFRDFEKVVISKVDENGKWDFDNVLVVVWSIYRAHAPQLASFPYPRLFFGDFLITFTRILLQFIGHIILCPLTINPANIIANVSVNNSRTGSASEINMFTASLTPNRTSANLVEALENLFSLPVFLLEGTNLFKVEEIGSFLKLSEPNLAFSFEEHSLKVHVNSTGMWGLEIVDRFSGHRNFYLGAGYRKGILSGSKPLSEWGKDPEGFYYFVTDISDGTLEIFQYSKEISYSKMAELLFPF